MIEQSPNSSQHNFTSGATGPKVESTLGPVVESAIASLEPRPRAPVSNYWYG